MNQKKKKPQLKQMMSEASKAVSKVFIGISAGMVVGVPIASFTDSTFSYEWAIAFFLIVNALVFLATLIFLRSMPVICRTINHVD